MVRGVLFSVLAGVLITFQGIFNTRLSEKIGLWHTNTLVHGSGLVLAFILLLFNEKINFNPIKNIDFYYLLGGFMGVCIVFSVMKSITSLGASYAITILIITQIITGFIVNYFGLFGETIVSLSLYKFLGLSLIIIGVIIYQLN